MMVSDRTASIIMTAWFIVVFASLTGWYVFPRPQLLRRRMWLGGSLSFQKAADRLEAEIMKELPQPKGKE